MCSGVAPCEKSQLHQAWSSWKSSFKKKINLYLTDNTGSGLGDITQLLTGLLEQGGEKQRLCSCIRVCYHLPLCFGSPPHLHKNVTWLKPHVTNYRRLGAESSSCKIQHRRWPLLLTWELSGQTQLPTTCSHPHAALWKHLSAYHEAKVIPDNIWFISPRKTLNIEWKVSTNSIDRENIALTTEQPRTTSHKPRPNCARLQSSPRRWDRACHPKAGPRGQLQSPSPMLWVWPRSQGAVPRLCPAPTVAQHSARIAGRLSERGWLGSSWLLHRQSKHEAVCTHLCRCPVSTRERTAAE